MKPLLALTTSITVLAMADTYLTATALPIPVFVTFIAWASFFACGGGGAGLMRSVASNLTGLIIAALCLAVISVAPASPGLAAVSVGLGSGLMILASSHRALGYPPAIVFGFASMVSTVSASHYGVTEGSLANPILRAVLAILVGAAFGFVSERLAGLLSLRSPVAATAP